MSVDKFCLRWNEFESNIQVAFQQLRDDKNFFDVTLTCDDEQVQARKIILSACSPFFRNILRRNPHQHPLLYLKGVKFTELQSVLTFMYHGEVNVAQEDLNSFLAVAEDLQVKGLTENKAASSKMKTYSSPSAKHTTTVKRESNPNAIAQNNGDDDIQEVFPVKSEAREMPSVNTFEMTGYQVQDNDYEQQEYVDYGHQQVDDAGYLVKGL